MVDILQFNLSLIKMFLIIIYGLYTIYLRLHFSNSTKFSQDSYTNISYYDYHIALDTYIDRKIILYQNTFKSKRVFFVKANICNSIDFVSFTFENMQLSGNNSTDMLYT